MRLAKYMIAALVAPFILAACDDDKLGPTIFPDVSDEPDPNSYTYKFDKWLNREFRDVYNVDFKYMMEDVEADMNYNLVPAKYDNARDLAVLTKYLWYDSYKDVAGPDFIKSYGPRILHLIGSPAYNASTGSVILGLAEGGLKVTLFNVNQMEIDDVDMLNEYYFRTMHHEFGHILHQTKSYPTDFNLLSAGRYDDSSWQTKQPGYVASLGFVTPYASSQTREDFAETIANYLTRSKDQMDLILWMSKQGWTTGKELAAGEEEKDDAEYFCYYYKDPSKPDTNKYFLTSADKKAGVYLIGLVGEGGEYLTTVEEVEEYLEFMREQHGEIYPVTDKDDVDGYDIIMQKQTIARNWFADQWKVSIDALRDEVQRRQANFDINTLRSEVEAIQ